MGVALLIAALVVAFVLLDILLLVYVFRRAARRKGGLVFSIGLSIGAADQGSNVRRLPEQDAPVELPGQVARERAEDRVIDLSDAEADLRWPEPSVWSDSSSLDDARHSRPSAASNAE
jgi:hypothetical protein